MAKNDQPKRTRDLESSVSARAVTAAKRLTAIIAELDGDPDALGRVCDMLHSRFQLSFSESAFIGQKVEAIFCE